MSDEQLAADAKPTGDKAIPTSPMPRDKRGWRVAPAPDGRGMPDEHKPPPPHRWRGFWIFAALVLAAGAKLMHLDQAQKLDTMRRQLGFLLGGACSDCCSGRRTPGPAVRKLPRG